VSFRQPVKRTRR